MTAKRYPPFGSEEPLIKPDEGDEICPVHGYPYKQQRGMANGIESLHCSYDGSLHPDVFMEWLDKPGTTLTPTDKNYKVYIRVASDDTDEMRVVSSTSREQRPGDDQGMEYGREWMAYEDAVERYPELRDDYERHLRHIETLGSSHPWRHETHWVQVGPRGNTREDKFYFEHLSDEQKTKFVEMLNAKKLNLDYPGHFYRLPFFISTAA